MVVVRGGCRSGAWEQMINHPMLNAPGGLAGSVVQGLRLDLYASADMLLVAAEGLGSLS